MLGKKGEDIAEKILLGEGYKILDRNYRTREGEIDIVAMDDEYIVFIEVKSGASKKYGAPEEKVTPGKIRKIIKAAQKYLEEKGMENTPWRIDVLALEFEKGKLKEKRLIKNAIFI